MQKLISKAYLIIIYLIDIRNVICVLHINKQTKKKKKIL